MNCNFVIQININDSCMVGFKNEKDVKDFIIETLNDFACVDSVHIQTQHANNKNHGEVD